ncbi:hypothetical protein TrST_g3279 [Triparma strigata]|uniref:Uncharacterized protein n=1 Tax=Triparma strigata TaxID=1606541 RepID=A0A9W7C4H4_9STRA|nr:hypothetical protein TrST_g3279 [Triparma strigata]
MSNTARRLILHTPASRSARLSAGKARTDYANKSTKHRTKEDMEKDSWPWQLAYLGYAAGVLSVPAAFCATVVEQPRFRKLLEGDEFGEGGSNLGRRLVGGFRDYYTEGKGFHNEDWPLLQYRRRIGDDRRASSVDLKIKSTTGQERSVSIKHDEVLAGADVAKRANLVDPIANVEVAEGREVMPDDPEAREMKRFEESILERNLRSLTQKQSAWQNYEAPSGASNSNDSGNASSNSNNSSSQQESAQSKASRVKEIEVKINSLEEAMNAPGNMLDIDSTLEEIERLKKEARTLKGWFSW